MLFVPEYDAKHEMANGLRAGTVGALKLTGVDETYDINEFHKFIEKYENMKIRIWGDLLPGKISNMDLHAKYLHDGLIKAAQAGADIFAITPIIHQNRVVKRPEEIEAIRQSAQIACEGYRFSRDSK